MTVDLPSRPPRDLCSPESPVQAADEELIIREARRRHRRRLLAVGGIAFVVIAGAVIVVLNLVEGGSSPEPSSLRPTLSSQPRQPLVTDSCRNGQLKVTSVGGGEGAGSVYMLFEFVNVSRSACNLSGYPRVVPVDRQGVQVAPGSPVTGPASSSFYNGQPPLTIDLKPGEAASSAIQGIAHPLSGQGLSCPASYPFFLVTPPNQTRSVKVPAKPPPGDPLPSAFPGCAPVAINSIVPGASGQLPQPPLPRASTGTPPSIPTTTLPESATDTSVG